jgi:hypothetical protein
VSDTPQGQGWWLASDGRWYPPQDASPPPPVASFAQGPTSYAPVAPAVGGNGLATAALVLGIVGICLFWFCGIGILLGVLAIVFGAIGMATGKKLPGEPLVGRAKAGLITGIVAVVVGIGFFVVAAMMADSNSVDFDEFNSDPSNGVCNEDRFLQDPDC